jgi:DNA-directed RNA polymerase specialized sigma54-like protein
MKFKDIMNETEKVKLTSSEIKNILKEFYKTSGKLGRQIQQMPVNNKTESILNKINKFIEEKGYLTEPAAYNLLSSSEKKYLEEF